jgi:hypothetical protein
MKEQVGIQGLIQQLKKEGPLWTTILPRLPRLIDDYLSKDSNNEYEGEKERIKDLNRKVRILGLTTAALALCVLALAWFQL